MLLLQGMGIAKRPVGVWIIFILNVPLVVSVLFGLYSILIGQSSLQLFASLIIQVLNLIGAIYLFRMRKESIYLFAAALLINIGTSITNGFQNKWYLLAYVLGWGISMIFIWYVWSLIKKNLVK